MNFNLFSMKLFNYLLVQVSLCSLQNIDFPYTVVQSSTSETERLLSERIPRWPSSSSLGDPLDHIGTSDLLRGTDRSSLRRPKSAEQVRSQPVSGIGSSHGYGGESLCVAVLDYQPDAASRSGHRHLELPLKEGDHVRIRGELYGS